MGGRIDKNGALTVTGRIKEQYKLLNGKFVIPTQVESAIVRSHLIDQCMIHGLNLPNNIAIVVPNWPAVLDRLKLPSSSNIEELIEHSHSVKDLILDEVITQCRDQKHYVIPKEVILLRHPFTPDNGMATPKISLKRRNILHTYHKKIEEVSAKMKQNC